MPLPFLFGEGARMNLYLVRHAHSAYCPDEGRPLSAAGRRDALKVADILSPRLRGSNVHLVSSDYRRAWETVEPLAQALQVPILQDLRLRERSLGPAGVPNFDEAVRQSWADPEWTPTGGESYREAETRVRAAIADALAAAGPRPVVVATHGQVMTLLMTAYLPEAGYAWWKALSMPDIYEVIGDAGAAAVVVRRLWPSPEAASP